MEVHVLNFRFDGANILVRWIAVNRSFNLIINLYNKCFEKIANLSV